MSVLWGSLQKLPWKFLNESLSFLPFYGKDLWPRKTEPRSPNSQPPQQSELVLYEVEHISAVPDRLTTAPLSHPALSLLNSCRWSHCLIKNALTSPINVGSQDHKDFIRKVSVTPNRKTYSGFSLHSLISTADSRPGESWHMHSTFVYEITCVFCSSPCYSCFLTPTPHSCSWTLFTKNFLIPKERKKGRIFQWPSGCYNS